MEIWKNGKERRNLQKEKQKFARLNGKYCLAEKMGA